MRLDALVVIAQRLAETTPYPASEIFTVAKKCDELRIPSSSLEFATRSVLDTATAMGVHPSSIVFVIP